MADQGYNLKYTGKEIDDLLDKADTMNSSAQVPVGGTSGQVLTKKSSANFDAEWKTPVSAGVQSVNGESGAVVLTADDVGALDESTAKELITSQTSGKMAASTYDPQGRQTDIFKAIDKVSNIYYARLTLNGWTACSSADQAKGLLYQQTATLTCANSHAPVVTAASEFLSGIGYDKTGVPATDDVLDEVQDIINDGVTVTAYNSVLVKVKEKPTAEIRARWVIQS